MDTNALCGLLSAIMVHYPKMRDHWINNEGKFNRFIVDEWHRCIGYLSLDDALERFDAYLKMPEGNRFAPDVKYFMAKFEKTQIRAEFKPNTMPHEWYVDNKGHLFDEEGREYGDNICSAHYYLDEKGRVCQMGMVIHAKGHPMETGATKFDYIPGTKEKRLAIIEEKKRRALLDEY